VPVPDPVRVSVVVPAFDEAATLPATLASLARQHVPGGFEVVVVDNASTDDTAAVAARLGARVVHEPSPGVCAARQAGTDAARGAIVVSTDADTVHPPGWLARIERQFADDDVVAVAGPCRYVDAPWWARLVPPLWFAAIAATYRRTGRIFYLTATNVAFRRAGFPGYDTSLTQGGDEVDLLRRLRSRGRVVWDAGNPVLTSSRRMDQGLLHTLLVSYGYHYALNLALSRLRPGRRMGVAPAVRAQDAASSRRLRRTWRAVLAVAVLLGLALRRRVDASVPRRVDASVESRPHPTA
jgi:glycosyltransferase involved in cell wall biosynthesis